MLLQKMSFIITVVITKDVIYNNLLLQKMLFTITVVGKCSDWGTKDTNLTMHFFFKIKRGIQRMFKLEKFVLFNFWRKKKYNDSKLNDKTQRLLILWNVCFKNIILSEHCIKSLNKHTRNGMNIACKFHFILLTS